MHQFKILRFSFSVLLIASIVLAFTKEKNHGTFKMPYQQAGLTNRQAAAHLIDRFTFGNKPGAIDEVMKMGLENWFINQAEGNQQDVVLTERLAGYDALNMSNEQVVATFPNRAILAKEAKEAGLTKFDSTIQDQKKIYRNELKALMDKKGYRPQSELFQQFISQKILAAAYSNNQLHQLLTEFWFNHFNVSISKNQCAAFIPAYERDVIRPNVTGKFSNLLLATAQSPAMLIYLDNYNSSGENDDFKKQQDRQKKHMEKVVTNAMEQDANSPKAKVLQKINNKKNNQGLNENYAREIMELHTLGVDGGYQQQDVTEAARVLTGWTVYPFSKGPGSNVKNYIERVGEENLIAKGFVHQGDFLFAMNRHDNAAKTVMGKSFAAGGGYQEGVELIKMLAHHKATAAFISKKIAIKFVNDQPPQSLVDKMTATFLAKDGDIKEVLLTMVSAPEFWTKDALAQKTKSPFELAISAVRALDATIKIPFILYQWITKMGQKIYYYQAPTGFPDKGQYWINTGSLLNRMNFGLAIAAQKIPGIEFNLAKLNNNHEPESANDALNKYSLIILPERNVAATIKRLTPLINDPLLQQKIIDAAGKATPKDENDQTMQPALDTMEAMEDSSPNKKKINENKLAKQQLRKGNKGKEIDMPVLAGNNNMLAQVVGIIIGSPEFQKR